MVKLSNKTTAKKSKKAPVRAVDIATRTYEGGSAKKLDTKSELFQLAASNMVSEDTFYEGATGRDQRFKNLIFTVTKDDPAWMQGFIPYLRNEMYMRTASIVAAAEYTHAGGPNARQVINGALQRADEPAEFLAYWMQNFYGWDTVSYPLPAPKLPQAVRKGLSDAVNRLYNEYSVMKYNGLSRGVSMGNVLNLVHPKSDGNNALYKYIIDRHHGNDLDLSELPKIASYNRLNTMESSERDKLIVDTEELRKAGITWESLSGWGEMNAKKWEAVIPLMGYMALLRNLRNFEQAGISKSVMNAVCERIADPDQVRKSKQFPFRFMSAFDNVNNVIWYPALEAALDTSVENIPDFDGSTLVAVDLSGSMGHAISQHSQMTYWKAGAVFGVALAYKTGNSTFMGYGTQSTLIDLPKGGSVLNGVKRVENVYRGGQLGYATYCWRSVQKHYDGQDRIVIFTDEQAHDNPGEFKKTLKNIHIFNFGGYGRTQLDLGTKGRYGYAGFTDKSFTLMNLLETTGKANWPWEEQG
jgi:hypothetical protein